MILVYGAYGYTGALVARRAAKLGLDVVLAGRRAGPLAALAAELGRGHRPFSLDDPAAVRAGIAGARAVLNCAGPFSQTAAPLVGACLAAGAHYLDVTGEARVLEAISRRDDEARAAGVTLLPGAGFDVVPSDCLAAHVARRLPGAARLRLAFQTSSGPSRGTALTALENAGAGGLVRADGALARERAGRRTIRVDFGRGPRTAISIPWGDLVTAFHTTGIPDIETYVAVPGLLRLSIRAAAVLALPPVRALVRRRILRGPEGPDARRRAAGESLLWAEATGPDGRVARARMRTPEAYELTSWTALELAARAARGGLPVGFQTPARACGADFPLTFPGVTREDV
jgi:short subunit dehydrogenase-like uncharacterized protein